MPAIIDKVVVRESSITLPTYEITGENRNPVFRSQYGVVHIYPYTLQDEIASKPRDKEYHSLVLENRYLRVTVIPDLGGRVYSVYDKVSQREVFYKNSIIKFSPLAIRGAFFSGGVEFSFPVAHAPTTADPVNWDIRENNDNSASIAFGGLEHISGLRWMITLTLFPNRCALAQDVQLFNPSSIPGRYHYWTNASLDADDQTEFIYPLRRSRSYEYAGTASWPFARLDLIQNNPGLPGMEGVPMWPANRLQKPINFRWQKNMIAQVSIFGRNVDWDFFGAWQHSVNHGYAHYARARDVAGMKLWSWGNAPVGVVNQTALTDDGSVYAETQCGAMETQLDFDFLQPGKIRSWREWWLPLRDLGGLTCASAEMGALLQLKTANRQHVNLHIGLCPVRPVEKATVSLSIPGKVLAQETIELSPEKIWAANLNFNSRELAGNPITLSVVDNSGNILIDYTMDREPSPIVQDQQPGGDLLPAEKCYQTGLKHENFDNREQAKEAYKQALALSPDHSRANYRYGLMLIRSGELKSAADYLQKAASHGIGEAYYFLGTIALHLDQLDEAGIYFRAAKQGDRLFPDSLIGLGCIALRKKDWNQARDYFKKACTSSDVAVTASLLLGIALRRAGQEKDAQKELLGVFAVTPLNHPVLRELALSLGSSGQEFRGKLQRMLLDDRQYFLDLACFYINAGLSEDALQVIVEASESWDYAMLGYLAGFLNRKLQKQEDASQWFEKGFGASLDYVFPGRLEEIQALEVALQHNPKDYHAMYLLGNYYYAHERYQEAMHLWEDALEGLPSYDVLLRNLGLAYWQRNKDLPKAMATFENALEINPKNYDIYLHLDDLYKVEHLTDKRLWLLEKIQSMEEPREDVRKRKVAMLIELGRYEEALKIMTNEKFVPLEMDQSFHDLYARAWMQKAEFDLKSNQIEQAIFDYQKALEYPDNLGVGQPTTLAQAEILYQLGCAYESLGLYQEALASWQAAAREHHSYDNLLYEYVQKALDKLSRYSELGLETINP